jgi:hypothetical protein
VNDGPENGGIPVTHSLHRCGKLQEKDYVWQLYHVKGVNDQDLSARLIKAIEIAEECGAANWGDVKTGTILSVPAEKIKARLTSKSRIRGVFSSQEQTIAFLRRIQEADLELCVIIAGVLHRVLEACETADVKPHTINYSLGVFGKKELLAEESDLAFTTMCGHHMVPKNVVGRLRERVKQGELSPQGAAHRMSLLCPCGIFNQERAAELLKKERKADRPPEK